MKVLLTCFTIALLFTGCSHRMAGQKVYSKPPQNVPSEHYEPPVENTSKNEGLSNKPTVKSSHPTMRPYVINGRKYQPTVVRVGEEFSGVASWYGPKFHGKKTSNGETYNMYAMTAAHKIFPMNTIVKVTNKRNGRSTVVRINDRGPFVDDRIIDLSKTAASKLDMIKTGTAPVELEVLGFEKQGVKKIYSTKHLKKGPQEVVVSSFAVQVGAFSRIEGAMITQEKFDGKDGYKSIIKDSESDDGKRLFRVYLTGFQSEQEARDYMEDHGIRGSFIVRE